MHTTIPRSLTRLRALTAGLLLLAVAGGCGDASSDPAAMLTVPETQAALEITRDLPSLPELLSKHDLERERILPEVDWEETWLRSDGRELRQAAYVRAAPVLAEAMTRRSLSDLLLDLDEVLDSTDRLRSTHEVPARIGAPLARARDLHERAVTARDEERPAEAVALVLEATDLLHGMTPERVAARMVSLAESGLRRIPSRDSYSREDLRRADRLTRGARVAMERGEWSRSVRRAYYACQILGVEVR